MGSTAPQLEYGEHVMSAHWAPATGITQLAADLPDLWSSALRRVGDDLRVRQYGARLNRIEWAGEYDNHTGLVLVATNVVTQGRQPHGFYACEAAPLDSNEEDVARYLAYIVQDAVARAGVAWPWGDQGGFLSPRAGAIATWHDNRRDRAVARIGDLADASS